MTPNKQLQRTVTGRRGRLAQRAAAERRRYAAGMERYVRHAARPA
jgi:hypothetical protein